MQSSSVPCLQFGNVTFLVEAGGYFEQSGDDESGGGRSAGGDKKAVEKLLRSTWAGQVPVGARIRRVEILLEHRPLLMHAG